MYLQVGEVVVEGEFTFVHRSSGLRTGHITRPARAAYLLYIALHSIDNLLIEPRT